MSTPTFVPLADYREYPVDDMRRRAAEFYQDLRRRRTVREFSSRPVPREILEDCLRTAATAPSGANQQPWHFVVVTDPALKKRIREGAEEEERAFYSGRAPDEWLEALSQLGTDEHKPFLEEAPCLIVIFAQNHGLRPDGTKFKHYYVTESVGIATGLLIAAVHEAGLVHGLSQRDSRPARARETLSHPRRGLPEERRPRASHHQEELRRGRDVSLSPGTTRGDRWPGSG
jgi:iodotyrosine deiodinase